MRKAPSKRQGGGWHEPATAPPMRGNTMKRTTPWRWTWLIAILALCALAPCILSGCAGSSSSSSGTNLLATTVEAESSDSEESDSASSDAASNDEFTDISSSSENSSSSSSTEEAETDWEDITHSSSESDSENTEFTDVQSDTDVRQEHAENADTAINSTSDEITSSSEETTSSNKTSNDTSTSKKASSKTNKSKADKADSNKNQKSDSEQKTEPEADTPQSNQVTVTFDSSNANAYNNKYPSTLGTFTVSIEPGDTVYDALVATGITFSERNGNYIDSIGGIAEKQCGATSGWMYSVDGKFPGKSAMKYTLEGGETIRWEYTVSMGDV